MVDILAFVKTVFAVNLRHLCHLRLSATGRFKKNTYWTASCLVVCIPIPRFSPLGQRTHSPTF